ncbi:D-alanine--poly(phosphoribitol) ligase subunit 1 [Paraburkholderia sp. GAS38]|uniref:amino acid adenylation domain-containing protein n=1 Tax=Paraburkholderia sp. GAS38 TaxID=3035133 RepID=UPI003D2279AF
MNHNLACPVYGHSLTTPDALAVACEGRSLSYAQTAQRAAQLAQCLTQSEDWPRRHGALPRVGILASRSIEACLAVLGTCWAGATYVPIGPGLPEERLLKILAACRLSAVIADQQGAKRLSKNVLGACPPLVIVPDAHASHFPEDTRKRLTDFASLPHVAVSEPTHVDANDTAYIIFTSGTTGVPKGVMISAGAIRHFIGAMSDLLGLRSSDRTVETCELGFDVSVHNMFSSWEAGASLHILPATQVMNAVRFARESGLTVWNSVPSLVGMLRQTKALKPDVLPDLRISHFGGEQLTDAAVAAWRAAAPNSLIYNLYGPTETTIYCLGRGVELPTPLTPGRDAVPIGTAFVGSEAAIFDEHGAAIIDNRPGELAIAGPQLADGYLDAPELTAQRFPTRLGKRWYLTGDLSLRDESGQFHYLGRIDNQVKVLGHRVELEEIEAHLRVVADVDLVGAVPWPMVEGSARGIVAFVGGEAVDAERICRELRTRLPAYMIPGKVFALANMPLNHSGKVDRRSLRDLLERESA